MTGKSMALISTLLALGLGAAATGLEAAQPLFHSGGTAVGAMQAHFEGRRHRGGHSGRFCGRHRGDHLESLASFVESFVDLDAEQNEAWNGLVTALRERAAAFDAVCAELEAMGAPATAPERLARAERMMEAGLAAIRDVRPALEAFYATLEPEQRKALDRLLSRHRRG